ncbi:MAG TPA: hypothetical protein PK919_00840 [Candidatus Aminicenantes bacterium]|nr:hypothetical protein [Candidatus Aminicenantes bacterium]
MRGWIVFACVASCCAAMGSAGMRRPDTYSFDWQGHQMAMGGLFEKEHAEEIVGLERRKIALLLAKEKVEVYMKYFEQGLRSDTGIILIEGEEQQWLEIAYWSGFRCRQLFMQGYVAGEAHRAGDPRAFIHKIE